MAEHRRWRRGRGVLVLNQRREGYEAGEWGLLGVDGRPTRVWRCAGKSPTSSMSTPRCLAARPPQAPVVVLHDEDSETLFHIDGAGLDQRNPRNANAYHDGLCGAWLWAHNQGHEVGFVHAERIKNQGIGPGYPRHPRPLHHLHGRSLCARLSAFCEAVIADGLCGFKTKDGIIADTAPALRQLFGAHLHDPASGIDEAWDWSNGPPTSHGGYACTSAPATKQRSAHAGHQTKPQRWSPNTTARPAAQQPGWAASASKRYSATQTTACSIH